MNNCKLVAFYSKEGYALLNVSIRELHKEVKVNSEDVCEHINNNMAVNTPLHVFDVDTVTLRAKVACCRECLNDIEYQIASEDALAKLKELFPAGVRFDMPGATFPYFWGPKLPKVARDNPIIDAFEQSAVAAVVAGLKGDDITSRAIEAARDAGRKIKCTPNTVVTG